VRGEAGARVVFHESFSKRKSFAILSSHLGYTSPAFPQYRDPVKVHRVFSSNPRASASARTLQFHRGQEGDSEKVVTPFMHVGTYPTRNFATLGPSELRPPFAGISGQCVNIIRSSSSTGQVSVPLLPLTSLQRPVFLVNSRSLHFCDAVFNQKYTLFSCVGTPSSEGTGLICRVPSSCFARAPGFTQPVHQGRFEVRSFSMVYVSWHQH